jgi:hypothetical protein
VRAFQAAGPALFQKQSKQIWSKLTVFVDSFPKLRETRGQEGNGGGIAAALRPAPSDRLRKKKE